MKEVRYGEGGTPLRRERAIVVLLPGIAAAVMVVLLSKLLAKPISGVLLQRSQLLSPILLAIILGLLLRNTLGLPSSVEPGLRFGLSKILRLGIILMGIRLSILSVVKIGSIAVGMIGVCILAGLAATWVAARSLGISERLGVLMAAGTSICGVSAVLAVAPTIEADEEEVSYAVATITIFGILATALYPYLAEVFLHFNVVEAGFFLGTSVHDTSQVTASSLIYDQLWARKTPAGLTGADIAIATKLVRNTFMVLVIPFLGLWFARKRKCRVAARGPKGTTYIPVFVFGYIAMVIVRSLGDYAFGVNHATWGAWCGYVNTSGTYLIAVAVSCMGLNTPVRKLAKLGYRPFLCGLVAASSVGIVSWLLVTQFGYYLQF